MMSNPNDYISRGDVLAVVKYCKNPIDEIENLPGVNYDNLVEVVRCKDCKEYDTSCCANGFGFCGNNGYGVMDEHFCSYGKRKVE